MKNVLRLAVQTQQIKQIKQRQHDDAATQHMPDGQSFDELIASTLGFFILVQQRKRRVTTQFMQDVVQAAVYLFKLPLILSRDFITPAKAQ